MVYPNLQALEIEFNQYGDHVDRIQYPTFPDSFVPFPNLQQLKFSYGYCLGDDVLFRGNHHSLKYLDLDLDVDLAKILADRCVFSTCKYKKLERVKIRLKDYLIDVVDEYTQAAADVGRYAKYMSFYNSAYTRPVAIQLLTTFCHNLQRIERLCLERVKFYFRGLPYDQEFHTPSGAVD